MIAVHVQICTKAAQVKSFLPTLPSSILPTLPPLSISVSRRLWGGGGGEEAAAAPGGGGRRGMRKGLSSPPGDYIHFKSQVPLHKISIATKQWRYYDFGPKTMAPLVCIPGIAGTADVYYKQIMFLSMKGYRVISVDIPQVWNHVEWIHAFEKFLDAVNVHQVHIYGSSLGGFLAQLFAQYRPRRVKSLILSNTFLDTQKFSAAMPWSPLVSWTPSFLLKRYILSGIHEGPHEPFIADSVDFVVNQVEFLSGEDVSSRLTLNVAAASVGSLSLPDSSITIMDTNDYCAVPQQLKDQVAEQYPQARRATLKSGGDFPFLSRPDEVNLYLQLHLRMVGLEAKPEPKVLPDDAAGSSSDKRSPPGDSDEPGNQGPGMQDDYGPPGASGYRDDGASGYEDDGASGYEDDDASERDASQTPPGDPQTSAKTHPHSSIQNEDASSFKRWRIIKMNKKNASTLQSYVGSLYSLWKPLLEV